MRPSKIAFLALLQDFFQRRLVAERGASVHTIASYRDTFELLLRYAEQRTGQTPSALTLKDLDAPMILDFLDHLELERGNTPRTRNLRLTAIRSFLRYASIRDPTSLAVAQRVLAIPTKRFDRPVLGYLSREEVEALLDAPDRCTWSGQRDAVLFAVLYNTGARVSEITGLQVADVLLDRLPCAFTARAAKSASSPSGRVPPRTYARGCHTSTAAPRLRCSPIEPASDCRAPASNTACVWRSEKRPSNAPPSPLDRSRPTPSDTRPRCTCSSLE